jgi:hypothetical protein
MKQYTNQTALPSRFAGRFSACFHTRKSDNIKAENHTAK